MAVEYIFNLGYAYFGIKHSITWLQVPLAYSGVLCLNCFSFHPSSVVLYFSRARWKNPQYMSFQPPEMHLASNPRTCRKHTALLWQQNLRTDSSSPLSHQGAGTFNSSSTSDTLRQSLWPLSTMYSSWKTTSNLECVSVCSTFFSLLYGKHFSLKDISVSQDFRGKQRLLNHHRISC